jgi:hypothetical protein
MVPLVELRAQHVQSGGQRDGPVIGVPGDLLLRGGCSVSGGEGAPRQALSSSWNFPQQSHFQAGVARRMDICQ